MTSKLEIADLRAEDSPSLLRLFEACKCNCYCRYWHFEGPRNDWLDRCANRASENREEALASARLGDASSRGVIATTDVGVVGWMKLAPASALTKLYSQRLYAGLACFNEVPRADVFAVGCFLIHPEFRRQGVASALLERGLEVASKRGAKYVEAFPRRGDYLYPEALATGPFDLFQRAGFEIVREFEPYPVLRKTL